MTNPGDFDRERPEGVEKPEAPEAAEAPERN